MKRTMMYSVGGQTLTVDPDNDQQFNESAMSSGYEAKPVRRFRVSGRTIDLADDEVNDFFTAAKSAGYTPEELRTYKMADGSAREMSGSEMSRYLRSPEYRESEDYEESRKKLNDELGSPMWAAIKGAISGGIEGALEGGKAGVAKAAWALPQVGTGVMRAVGNLANGLGNGRNALGDALVRGANAADAKMEEIMPTSTAERLGYEDWGTKTGDFFGNVAGMAVKFAPAGGTSLAAKVFTEAMLASDGVNAYEGTLRTAQENGADVATANALGMVSGLVNYFGGKALLKAGGVSKDIKNPLLRELAAAATSGGVMGVQGGANKAIENAATNKDVGEGVLGAVGEGLAEGALFHGANMIPRAPSLVRQTKAHFNAAKDWITEAAANDPAMLSDLMDQPALDEVIAARRKGESVSRKMGDDIFLPNNMSGEQRNAVVDSIIAYRDGAAEAAKNAEATKAKEKQAAADRRGEQAVRTFREGEERARAEFNAEARKNGDDAPDAELERQPVTRNEGRGENADILQQSADQYARDDADGAKAYGSWLKKQGKRDTAANRMDWFVNDYAKRGDHPLTHRATENEIPDITREEYDKAISDWTAKKESAQKQGKKFDEPKPYAEYEDYDALLAAQKSRMDAADKAAAEAAHEERGKGLAEAFADWREESVKARKQGRKSPEPTAEVEDVRAKAEADVVVQRLNAEWQKAKTPAERNAIKAQLIDRLKEIGIGATERGASAAESAKAPDGRGRMVEKPSGDVSSDSVKSELERYVGKDELSKIKDKAYSTELEDGGSPEDISILAETCRGIANRTGNPPSAKSLAEAVADAWSRHTYESIKATADIVKDAYKRDGKKVPKVFADEYGIEPDADFYQKNAKSEEERLVSVYGKKPQPSQPLENATSRAPHEKGTTSQAKGAEGVEARSSVEIARSVIEGDALARKVIGNAEISKDVADRIANAKARLDEAEKNLDSAREMERTDLTKGGNTKPERRKARIEANGRVAEIKREISDEILALVKSAKEKSPSTRVPDGKGKMVEKPAPSPETKTKSVATAPVVEKAKGGEVAVEAPDSVEAKIGAMPYGQERRKAQFDYMDAEVKKAKEAIKGKFTQGKDKKWTTEDKSVAPTITVKVPADGEFTVANNPDGIALLEKMSAKLKAQVKDREKELPTGHKNAHSPFIETVWTKDKPSATPKSPSLAVKKPAKNITVKDAAEIVKPFVDKDRKSLTKPHVGDGVVVATDGRRLVVVDVPGAKESGEEYPNWKQVIPKKTAHEAKFSTEELYTKLEQAKVVVMGDAHSVEIYELADGSLGVQVKSEAAEYSTHEKMPKNARLVGMFNVDFLLDATKTAAKMGDKEMRIGYNDSYGPVIHRGNGYKQVIMPLHLSSVEPADRLAALRSDAKVKSWAQKNGYSVVEGEVSPRAVTEYLRSQTKKAVAATKRLFKDAEVEVKDRDWNAEIDGEGALNSVSNLYTGSAADYEKPSLLKVGTGEGAQVFGWGLYGSKKRGVAESYAKQDAASRGNGKLPFFRIIDGAGTKKNGRLMSEPKKSDYPSENDPLYYADFVAWSNPNLSSAERDISKYGEAVQKAFHDHVDEYEFANDVADEYVYEQTFFTNRPEGDESHLLNWYERISAENAERINRQLAKEGFSERVEARKGGDVYSYLSKILKSPKAASEFLVQADIDGVKYPIGTFGHYHNRDGRKGWNYVSFRDDNINIDHKWRDGKQLYLRNDGRVVGTFDPATKKVTLYRGADERTVYHELIGHGVEDWARRNNTALHDKLTELARTAPRELVEDVRSRYPDADEATLTKEIIARVAEGKGLENIKLKDAPKTWYAKAYVAVKDALVGFMEKIGLNRIDLSKTDDMTPSEAMDYLMREIGKGRTLGEIGTAEAQGKMTRAEKWANKYYDRHTSLGKVSKEAADAKALQPGREAEFEIMKFNPKKEEFKKLLKDGNVTGNEVDEYMRAVAAKERNAADGWESSGMSDERIDATRRFYENHPRIDAIKRAADFMWKKVQDEGMRERIRSGLVSEAEYAEWKSREEHHVPFRSAVDENGDHIAWNDPRGVAGHEFVQHEGRYSESGSPTAWMFEEYANAHLRAIENDTRKVLADAVSRDASLGAVTTNPNLRESRLNGDGGDRNVVSYKVVGENGRVVVKHIVLKGERGAAAASSYTNRDLMNKSPLLKKTQAFMRFWSSTATEWSPTFALRNTFADNVDLAAVVLAEKGAKEGGAWIRDYAKNRVAVAKEVWRFARKGEVDANSMLGRYVREGGMIGGFQREGYGDLVKQFSAEDIAKDFSNGGNRAKAVAKKVFGLVGAVNTYAELMTRVSAFKTNLDNGMSAKDAALWSRRVSVDFNRKGNVTPITNTLFMFSNSTIGATMRQLEAVNTAWKTPQGKRALLGLAAFGVAEALLEHAMNADSDEEREKKGEATGKDVNEFTRKTSLYVRVGGHVFRAPAHEDPLMKIVYAANAATRVALGTMSKEDFAKEVGLGIVEDVPRFFGQGSKNVDAGFNTWVPTALQPLVQGIENKDYAGRPIYRPKFSEALPDSSNGRKSTQAQYKWAAETVNALTGGNRGRKGSVDIAPETVKLISESLGKNVGKDIGNAIDVGWNLLTGNFGGLDSRRAPIVRDVVRKTEGNDNRYFEAVRRFNADKLDLQTRDKARNWKDGERRAYYEAHPHLRKNGGTSTRVERLINGHTDGDTHIPGINDLRRMEGGERRVKTATGWKWRAYDWSAEKVDEFRRKRLEKQAKVLAIMGD